MRHTRIIFYFTLILRTQLPTPLPPLSFLISNIYHKEYPGLPPHDGKDSRGISFARYIIWSCHICLLKDYEMIELFFSCLTGKDVGPEWFMNKGMLPAFFEAIHKVSTSTCLVHVSIRTSFLTSIR